jgi:hypothetical protein
MSAKRWLGYKKKQQPKTEKKTRVEGLSILRARSSLKGRQLQNYG